MVFRIRSIFSNTNSDPVACIENTNFTLLRYVNLEIDPVPVLFKIKNNHLVLATGYGRYRTLPFSLNFTLIL
jgi:hypothetical protein